MDFSKIDYSKVGFQNTEPETPIKDMKLFNTLDVVKFDDIYKYAGESIGYVSKYPEYATWRDNEDFYAQQQSGWDKASNAMAGFLTLGKGAFVNKAMSVPNIISSIAKGDWNNMFENETAQDFAEQMSALSYLNPIYETKEQRTLQNQIGDSAFENSMLSLKQYVPMSGRAGNAYANLVQQLGFTAGTALELGIESWILGAITAEVGGAAGWARAASGVQKLVKGLATFNKLNKVDDVARLAVAGNTIAKGRNLMQVGNVLDKGFTYGVRGVQAFTTAASEGAVEAASKSMEYRQEEVDKIYNSGRVPTEKELLDIDTNARDIGNIVLNSNLPILLVGNALTLGKFFYKGAANSIKNPITDLIKPVFKNGSLSVMTTKELAREAGKIGLAKYYGKGLLTWGKNSVSEGVEELLQGVAGKAATKYVEQMENPAYNSLMSYAGMFAEQTKETLQTREGWDEFWAGFLTGAPISVMGSTYDRVSGVTKQKEENLQKAKVDINNALQKLPQDIRQKVAENSSPVTNRSMENTLVNFLTGYQSVEASNKGEVKKAKDFESEGKAQFFYTMMKYDMLEEMVDQMGAAMEDLKTNDPQAYKEQMGERTIEEVKQSLLRDGKEYDKIFTSIDKRAVNPYNKNKEFTKFAAYEQAKRAYTDLQFFGLDSTNRANALRGQIESRNAFSNTILNGLIDPTSLKANIDRLTKEVADKKQSDIFTDEEVAVLERDLKALQSISKKTFNEDGSVKVGRDSGNIVKDIVKTIYGSSYNLDAELEKDIKDLIELEEDSALLRHIANSLNNEEYFDKFAKTWEKTVLKSRAMKNIDPKKNSEEGIAAQKEEVKKAAKETQTEDLEKRIQEFPEGDLVKQLIEAEVNNATINAKGEYEYNGQTFPTLDGFVEFLMKDNENKDSEAIEYVKEKIKRQPNKIDSAATQAEQATMNPPLDTNEKAKEEAKEGTTFVTTSPTAVVAHYYDYVMSKYWKSPFIILDKWLGLGQGSIEDKEKALSKLNTQKKIIVDGIEKTKKSKEKDLDDVYSVGSLQTVREKNIENYELALKLLEEQIKETQQTPSQTKYQKEKEAELSKIVDKYGESGFNMFTINLSDISKILGGRTAKEINDTYENLQVIVDENTGRVFVFVDNSIDAVQTIQDNLGITVQKTNMRGFQVVKDLEGNNVNSPYLADFHKTENKRALNKLKAGDSVELRIANSLYNKQLQESLDNGTITEEEFYNNVGIEVLSDGYVIGVMRRSDFLFDNAKQQEVTKNFRDSIQGKFLGSTIGYVEFKQHNTSRGYNFDEVGEPVASSFADFKIAAENFGHKVELFVATDVNTVMNAKGEVFSNLDRGNFTIGQAYMRVSTNDGLVHTVKLTTENGQRLSEQELTEPEILGKLTTFLNPKTPIVTKRAILDVSKVSKNKLKNSREDIGVELQNEIDNNNGEITIQHINGTVSTLTNAKVENGQLVGEIPLDNISEEIGLRDVVRDVERDIDVEITEILNTGEMKGKQVDGSRATYPYSKEEAAALVKPNTKKVGLLLGEVNMIVKENIAEKTPNINQARINSLYAELATIEDDNNPRIAEIDAELEILERVGAVEEQVESEITEQEYSDFIDKGIVTSQRINSIAEKVKNNKPLSQREVAIFNDKTSEINSRLATLQVEEDKKDVQPQEATVEEFPQETTEREKLQWMETNADFNVAYPLNEVTEVTRTVGNIFVEKNTVNGITVSYKLKNGKRNYTDKTKEVKTDIASLVSLYIKSKTSPLSFNERKVLMKNYAKAQRLFNLQEKRIAKADSEFLNTEGLENFEHFMQMLGVGEDNAILRSLWDTYRKSVEQGKPLSYIDDVIRMATLTEAQRNALEAYLNPITSIKLWGYISKADVVRGYTRNKVFQKFLGEEIIDQLDNVDDITIRAREKLFTDNEESSGISIINLDRLKSISFAKYKELIKSFFEATTTNEKSSLDKFLSIANDLEIGVLLNPIKQGYLTRVSRKALGKDLYFIDDELLEANLLNEGIVRSEKDGLLVDMSKIYVAPNENNLSQILNLQKLFLSLGYEVSNEALEKYFEVNENFDGLMERLLLEKDYNDRVLEEDGVVILGEETIERDGKLVKAKVKTNYIQVNETIYKNVFGNYYIDTKNPITSFELKKMLNNKGLKSKEYIEAQNALENIKKVTNRKKENITCE